MPPCHAGPIKAHRQEARVLTFDPSSLQEKQIIIHISALGVHQTFDFIIV